MAQKQNEKEALKCTHGNCQELQDGDGEYCPKHYPKKIYLVDVEWTTWGSMYIEAENKAQAMRKAQMLLDTEKGDIQDIQQSNEPSKATAAQVEEDASLIISKWKIASAEANNIELAEIEEDNKK